MGRAGRLIGALVNCFVFHTSRSNKAQENGMASEKHLDAEWKRIQKKTFTRWCNEHLKVQGVLIDDLNAGLSDGVKLITLVEVLSQKKVGRYNKKPRVHAQRMENVDQALRFISKTEKIRVVNIGGLSTCFMQ